MFLYLMKEEWFTSQKHILKSRIVYSPFFVDEIQDKATDHRTWKTT